VASISNRCGVPENTWNLKPLLLSVYLTLVALACAAIVFAPSLGLGEKYDFVLHRWFGVPRSLALQLLLWPTSLLLWYELLSAGVVVPAGRSRVSEVVKSAWHDGSAIAQRLTAGTRATATGPELWLAIALGAIFAVAFAIFLSRTLAWFAFPVDQHWWQTMMSYGIDWRAPAFSFGGNLLYSFGIQVPLKGQLLPLEGAAAYWSPVQHQIAATIALCFLATGVLFWCIGVAIGLNLIWRTIFAGLVALITTVPVGLNYVLPFLPPRFFTHQFTLALWWGEAPILLLSTVFVFLLIGRQKSIFKNLLASAGFILGAFAPLLSYTVGAVFFMPLMALYCFGLFLTCESRAEWFWKVGVSIVVAVMMIFARVPQFLSNLYSYSFGAYFFEFSPDAPPSFKGNFLFASHIDDPRGLVAFVTAFVALAMVSYKARGVLRRIAIAALVCEGGIILVTTINLWVWQVPLAGAYAELGHAPMWGSFFILAVIVVAMLSDRRVVQLADVASPKYSGLLRYAVERRQWVYSLFLVTTIAGFWLFQQPPDLFSDYPPQRHASIELIAREIGISSGAPFRGRLMTVVPADFPGPSDLTSFTDVTVHRYRRHLGNDHYIDAGAFDIPMVNEYGYWAAPPTFAFYRIFFGKEGEGFGRAWFVLSRFDLRMARLIGVRMVATDASVIAGGTLVYETRAGDTDLRIFRIDDTNVGQYSPTRARPARTAADAIAAMGAPDFDPKRDVAVEGDIPTGLVPAISSIVTVERGPKLVVRAESAGRSLLVLPFEYSYCLRMKAAGDEPQLIPVNLQQVGLLFVERVEAEITYEFGLFGQSRCRGEDRKRADGLQLKEALMRNSRATLTKKRPTLW
jgi:hypothetical protein